MTNPHVEIGLDTKDDKGKGEALEPGGKLAQVMVIVAGTEEPPAGDVMKVTFNPAKGRSVGRLIKAHQGRTGRADVMNVELVRRPTLPPL